MFRPLQRGLVAISPQQCYNVGGRLEGWEGSSEASKGGALLGRRGRGLSHDGVPPPTVGSLGVVRARRLPSSGQEGQSQDELHRGPPPGLERVPELLS